MDHRGEGITLLLASTQWIRKKGGGWLGSLHDKASLRYECACGSWASEGGGSAFHRSHKGTASLLCELTREREDGPPGGRRQHELKTYTWAVVQHLQSFPEDGDNFLFSPGQIWSRMSHICMASLQSGCGCASWGWLVGWTGHHRCCSGTASHLKVRISRWCNEGNSHIYLFNFYCIYRNDSYQCERSCGLQGCPCSGRRPGSSHTCMACHCGLGPCGLSGNLPL